MHPEAGLGYAPTQIMVFVGRAEQRVVHGYRRSATADGGISELSTTTV
jgi:hypothetical protein